MIDGQGAPETGPGSTLTPADLVPQGSTDFNSPQEAPVVQALGSVNQYDRPWRGGGQGQPDYDFLDEVQASDNDQPLPIAIEVFEGPLLAVTVSASRTTVPVGGTVTFSTTVTGQNGSALSYSWSFGGAAQSSTAANPQVSFGTAGQYDVTVEVTDTSGGGGGAEIPITVGTPAAPTTGRHKQTGAGTNRKSHSPSGPRKSKGSHAGGQRASRTPASRTRRARAAARPARARRLRTRRRRRRPPPRRPTPARPRAPRLTTRRPHHIAPRRREDRPDTRRCRRRAQPRRHVHPARSSPGCWSAT